MQSLVNIISSDRIQELLMQMLPRPLLEFQEYPSVEKVEKEQRGSRTISGNNNIINGVNLPSTDNEDRSTDEYDISIYARWY